MNLKQHRFVTEYLRHRDAMTAYSIAYNYQTSNYASLQSLANRLMNHPEVSAAIHAILDGIRHDVQQEIKAELKVELLTVQRKREILAKIAAGEFYAVHNYKGKDCNMCTQHVWPTINQVLKAIDLDNKMAGHYSVDKRQFAPYPPEGETKVHNNSQQTRTTPLHDKAPLGVGVEQNTIMEQETHLLTMAASPEPSWKGTITNSEACLLPGEVDPGRTENPQGAQQMNKNNCPPQAGVSAGRGWNTRELPPILLKRRYKTL